MSEDKPYRYVSGPHPQGGGRVFWGKWSDEDEPVGFFDTWTKAIEWVEKERLYRKELMENSDSLIDPFWEQQENKSPNDFYDIAFS